MSWKDTDSGSPTIDLFAAADFAQGGIGYLTNSDTGLGQLSSQYMGRLGPGQTIDLNWGAFANALVAEHIIFCGVSRGKGELLLTIKNGTNIVGETSAWIEIKDVKELYERWTIGDSPKIAPANTAYLATEGLPTGMAKFQYSATTDTNTPYILFVHGWNMEQWEKDRFAERAFKRLYWQGYQGRFGLFRWPTDYGFEPEFGVFTTNPLTYPRHYDDSEFIAWRSAEGLLSKLNDLNAKYPGHLYMLAHSMGNVVASEALRLSGSNQVANTYVATQAAIPAHTYDNSLPDYSFTLEINWGPFTPNIYKDWFSSNSGGVGRRINFYNTNDYALSRPHWELDQLFKPDTSWLGWTYGFNGYPHTGYPNSATNHYSAGVDDTPPWNWFFKENFFGTDKYFDIVNVLTNRYEVMAYAAQSRSSALGRTAGIANLTENLDLATIWPPDTNPDFQNSPYGEHFYHSAQFRGDYWQEWTYWNSLLFSSRYGFNISNP